MNMCDIEEITSRLNRGAAAANVFARGILLPEKDFRAEVRKNGALLHLSKLFKVSTLVLRIRAKELGMSGHGF
jgi:Zn-dependent peptidase ImmA (M78 family)